MKSSNPIEFNAENGAQDVGRITTAIKEIINSVYADADRTPEFEGSFRGTVFCDASTDLDFTHFYQKNGSKITRGLRGVLLKMFLKPNVEQGFSEFCKRIGDLYIEIVVTASIVKPYFSDRGTGNYGMDDKSSCFREGGQNECNGKFIDFSPSTGVLCIGTPDSSRYAPGRMILWIKTETEAHLLNQYTTDGRSGLPYSLFVRALERLSGTKITFKHVEEKGHRKGFLPVYTNNGNIVCTATEGNFLSLFEPILSGENPALQTDSPGKFHCPECERSFTFNGGYYSNDGSNYLIGCSDDCADVNRERCDDCNCVVDEDDRYFDEEGTVFCQDCYDSRFSYCEECENAVPNDSMVPVHDSRGCEEFVCESCRDRHYAECWECGDYHPNDSLVSSADTNNDFCPSCAENLAQCQGCDDLYKNVNKLDEDGNCKDCHVDPEPEEEEEDIEMRPVVTDVPVTL